MATDKTVTEELIDILERIARGESVQLELSSSWLSWRGIPVTHEDSIAERCLDWAETVRREA